MNRNKTICTETLRILYMFLMWVLFSCIYSCEKWRGTQVSNCVFNLQNCFIIHLLQLDHILFKTEKSPFYGNQNPASILLLQSCLFKVPQGFKNCTPWSGILMAELFAVSVGEPSKEWICSPQLCFEGNCIKLIYFSSTLMYIFEAKVSKELISWSIQAKCCWAMLCWYSLMPNNLVWKRTAVILIPT